MPVPTASTLMGRKKQDAVANPQPEKTSTKVEREILRKARAVADYKRIDLFDYLDSLLRSSVEDDYSEMLREEQQRRTPKSKGGGD